MNILKSFSILLFFLCFSSCTSDISTNDEASNSSYQLRGIAQRFAPKEFDYIGLQHNEVLDMIKNDMLEGNVSNAELQDYTAAKVYNEVAKSSTTEQDLSIAKDYININLHTKPGNFDTSFYASLENEKFLSNLLKNYLDNLHAIILKDGSDAETIVSEIEALEGQAYNDAKLSNDDLLVLYPTTSVAKHSIIYWTENFQIWENHILGIKKINVAAKEKPKTPGRRLAEIATYDAAGAVAAAAHTWYLNVWVGPGQAAYGSAIIGGAIVGSAGNAVYQIAASIFQWD